MKSERRSQGKSILAQRGIEKAARLAGWTDEKRGWTYPVYDLVDNIIAHRGKSYYSNAQPKYWWVSGKPANCHYYILPGLQKAVEAANGLVYIVSGEPDLLVMHSTGIHNVISWFGEASIPRNLPEFLKNDLHTNRVIQFPDRDKVGHKSAQKTATLLSDSGIDYQAHELPEYLGDRGDLNKLWQYHGFQVEAFLDSLQNETTLLNIQPEKSRPRKPAQHYSQDAQKFENERDEYHAAIADKLGVGNYQKKGWSNPIPCPMHSHSHDDTNPSAYWHPEMHILRCFKCGDTYLAKEVAAVLGINLQDFIKPEEIPALPEKTTDTHKRVEDLRYFPNGVPDVIRSTLLSIHLNGPFYDHGSAVVVLDLRQEAIADGKLAEDDIFTVNQLVDIAVQLGRKTRAKTIRTGIKQLIALGFFADSHTVTEGRGRPTEYFKARRIGSAVKRLLIVANHRLREKIFGDDIPDTIEAEWFEDIPPEIAKQIADHENGIRWKTRLYELEIHRNARKRYKEGTGFNASRLNLSKLLEGHSTPLLPGSVCPNARDYRVLFLKSIITEAGSGGRPITRAKAAWQLGVSNKTLSLVRLRAGVIAIPQFIQTGVDLNAGNVLRQVDAAVPWAAGRPYGRFLEASNGSRLPLFPEMSEKIIQKWRRTKEMEGFTASVALVQTASQERFATPEEYSEMLEKQIIRDEKRRLNAGTKTGEKRTKKTKAKGLLGDLTGQRTGEGLAPSETSSDSVSGQSTGGQIPVVSVPRYECVPETVTRKYIWDQLQLTPERKSMPPELFPYLLPYLEIENISSSKKGNKSPPEHPD